MKLTAENADVYSLAAFQGGTLLYDGAEGSIVQAAEGGTILSDILNGTRLCALLRELFPQGFDLICVKSVDAQRHIMQEFGFTGVQFCSQWVYRRQEPPVCPPCDIRALTLSELDIAYAHYHPEDDNRAYLRARIEAGRMWGIYVGNVLAGFIGTHSEGSMGILEIFPEYRRRGYGAQMERFLIGELLSLGQIPYGHVVDGNTASLGLQASLGMERCQLPAIWLWK